MQKPNVSAILLNYNSSADCKKCLGFLNKQDYPALSMIVVDNASTEESEIERLQAICSAAGARLMISEENRGFSAGNNIGLRAACEDGAAWMLVINPDVELRDPHYISYIIEQLLRWPQAAIIGTNVLMPNGVRQNPMREISVWEEIFWPSETVKQRLGLWDGNLSENRTGYCEKLSGCCFMISRDFFVTAHGLDEKVFLYCEEPILAKTVLRYGYRELYLKEVTAYHEHYGHAKTGNSQSRMALFLKSRIYYINEYSGYQRTLKRLALFSRRIQAAFWNAKKQE